MKIRQKQVAAALAAVEQYLQEEEAAALSAQAVAAAATERPAAEPGFWAQAGRMEAMGVRRMMQMRAFARIR